MSAAPTIPKNNGIDQCRYFLDFLPQRTLAKQLISLHFRSVSHLR
jgi:hypothetical protein